MKEIRGDLFKPSSYSDFVDPDAVCITTNGFVKKNGKCVMGRGCAAQAAKLWPHLPGMLGAKILERGNITQVITVAPVSGHVREVVSFPVKPQYGSANFDRSNVVKHMRKQFNHLQTVPGWAMQADPQIIESSAKELVTLTDAAGWTAVVLPRPGCGAGELKWIDIASILEKILDDRFYSITY